MEWQTRLYTKMLWDSPEQIVWTNMVMPTELFYACGLAPVHAEMTAGWISSLLLSKEYIRVAEERGFHVGLAHIIKQSLGQWNAGDPTAPLGGIFLPYLRRRERAASVLPSAVPHADIPPRYPLSAARGESRSVR